jgi:hypothetical protein
LNTYVAQLCVFTNNLNKETFDQDYIILKKWTALKMIKEQLKPLFYVTKELKSNINLKNSDYKAFYRQLGKLLPVFEYILNYFKKLKQKLKA